MKNKGGLFTGWKQVFAFTAQQNMKGKGFKISTLGIGALLFAVFVIINCVFANDQLEESKKDPNQVIDIEDTSIKTIYYLSKDESSKQVVDGVVAAIKDSVKIQFKEASLDMIEGEKSDETGSVVMVAYVEKDVLKFEFNITEVAAVDKEDVDTFAYQFVSVVNNMKYSMAGLSQVQIAMINSSEMIYSDVISVEDIDEEMDVALMVAELVVPMVFSALFYIMVLAYCQSVTKIVVAEKTSKLMEMLLTSVQPYAVISGKVLAMAAIGIGQTLLWVVCGVAGYIVGDKIALSIYPDYQNFIGEIIELMQTESNIAFAPSGIVLALVSMILGFLLYCLLAGLAGAMVGKIEDLSASQMIYMLPTIIGFLASYMLPMLENKSMLTVIRMIPIISPFMVPAEFVIGKMSLAEGLASLGILLVTCVAMIIVTGKVYKNKVFNRG